MAYRATSGKTGQTYHLHKVAGVNGNPLYHFRPTVNPATAVSALPKGFRVSESAQTGLPLLTKGAVAAMPVNPGDGLSTTPKMPPTGPVGMGGGMPPKGRM